LKRGVALALVSIGVALILFSSYIAWIEYKNANTIKIPENLATSLSSVLSVFTVIAVKAVFVSIMVWGGSIILSNGIKLLITEKVATDRKENSVGEDKDEGD
jgi:hypothetical protein